MRYIWNMVCILKLIYWLGFGLKKVLCILKWINKIINNEFVLFIFWKCFFDIIVVRKFDGSGNYM